MLVIVGGHLKYKADELIGLVHDTYQRRWLAQLVQSIVLARTACYICIR